MREPWSACRTPKRLPWTLCSPAHTAHSAPMLPNFGNIHVHLTAHKRPADCRPCFSKTGADVRCPENPLELQPAASEAQRRDVPGRLRLGRLGRRLTSVGKMVGWGSVLLALVRRRLASA